MKLSTVVILIGLCCIAGYIVYANDSIPFEFPKERTPACDNVQDQMFTLINNDRHLFNVPPAQLDGELTLDSIEISKNMPISYISKPWDRFDYFVVKKSDWSRRYYFSPQYEFDRWTNTDLNFRNDVLNRDYNRVGVGVSEDSTNYYIVIRWK